MALKAVPAFRIKGIGPTVTERLNHAGIYTIPDAQRYADTYGACGLMEVMGVGPRRARKLLRKLEGGRCPRCGKAVTSGEMDTAYEAVLSRKECPFMPQTKPPKDEAFKEPETPPLPWVGGKRKMVDDILPLIPEHSTYVEPLFGSGAVFFAKQPAEVNVINDKDEKLMQVYRDLKAKGDIDLDLRPDHARFKSLQRKPNEERTTKEWLYLLKLGFGHKAPGSDELSWPGKSAVKNFANHTIKAPERLKTNKLRIMSASYPDVVDKYNSKGTFFFMDPPYHETSNPYDDPDVTPWHIREVMEGVKGKVMVTYNNHPDVKEAFSGWHIKTVETAHTLQGGQRRQKELIITNYPIGEGS
ncbi:MAG: DNA adenine methylase [Thaumarchaeota archaeon]|nr:DNA adenine methylase [Nitrososphaerota archaeon]